MSGKPTLAGSPMSSTGTLGSPRTALASSSASSASSSANTASSSSAVSWPLSKSSISYAANASLIKDVTFCFSMPSCVSSMIRSISSTESICAVFLRDSLPTFRPSTTWISIWAYSMSLVSWPSVFSSICSMKRFFLRSSFAFLKRSKRVACDQTKNTTLSVPFILHQDRFFIAGAIVSSTQLRMCGAIQKLLFSRVVNNNLGLSRGLSARVAAFLPTNILRPSVGVSSSWSTGYATAQKCNAIFIQHTS
ncbi:unnamed protein product [Ixodes pacificus]